jgi:hypothetical protein
LFPRRNFSAAQKRNLRSRGFESQLGYFHFSHTPRYGFFLGVSRVKTATSVFFMASPWKALADYIYVYKKSWDSIREISEDLRIEIENLINKEELEILSMLCLEYPSKCVRIRLSNLSKTL